MPRTKSENSLTDAERTARHRLALKERGGRQMAPITLDADDARKLADIKAIRGVAHDAEIVRVLIREA